MGKVGRCWHPTSEIVVAPPDGAVCQVCGDKVDWSQDLDADLVARLDILYDLVKSGEIPECPE